MDQDRLRTLVASLVFAGDFQELMHLYGLEDVSLAPEELARVYDPSGLQSEDRAAFDEIKAAIPDDLLPRPDQPVSAPAEMVELTGRCAAERGKLVLAVKAFREVNAVGKYHQLYTDFALESLALGRYEQAAFELLLAGRLGWNSAPSEERTAFVIGLGIDANELASALGAERSRGKVSGGRALPDFPALQTYGPLLHARCGATGCVSRRPLAETVLLAIRLLIHDDELARRALEAAGDQAPRLLQCLAREMDPELGEYARAYEQAWERFRKLEAETQQDDAEEDARPVEEAAEEPTQEAPGSETDGKPEAGEETGAEEGRRKSTDSGVLRAGLEGVQRLLLGRPEKLWRNCLAELAARHPLSLFTVCTVRAGSLGMYVIPAGETPAEFLTAVRGP